MAFQAQNWGVISPTGNTQQTLQNGTVIGAPAIYTYQSPTDNTATITAVDYFVPVDVNLAVGDLIYIIATDSSEWYNVLAVDVDTGNIIIGVSPSTGDVTGPASSTNNAFALFSGTTGKLLKNSVGFMDSTGNITGTPSISLLNPAGTFSTKFTGAAVASAQAYTTPLTQPTVNGMFMTQAG